jgi:hypothetical protein
LKNGYGRSFYGNELVTLELLEDAAYGFTRGIGHFRDFSVGEGHGQAAFGSAFRAIAQWYGLPFRSRAMSAMPAITSSSTPKTPAPAA